MNDYIVKQLTTGAIIIAIAGMLCCCGCAVVRVTTPKWSMTGVSIFKTISVPQLIINGSNADVIVTDYVGTVDGAAMGQAVGTAIKAAGYGK